MLNSYIDDKTAIGALTEDFENYLRLCRLLMRIYNTASTAAFRALYLDFLRAPGDCIVPRSGLSLATLPRSTAKLIENNEFHSSYYDISGCFFDSLRQFSCTEILPFPPEQDPALHTAMLGVADISLTEAQHAAHLQHVLSLLETGKNYELVLSDGIVPHTAILAKQNVGVLMVNTKPPYCAFAFDEQNMVEAFWDYLSNIQKNRRAGRGRSKLCAQKPDMQRGTFMIRTLSIQKKIILWFAAALALIVFLMSAMTLAIANSVLDENIRERLAQIVSENAKQIDYYENLNDEDIRYGDQFLAYQDGWLGIDDDFCNIYEGIYTALYDADGNLLYGSAPIRLAFSAKEDSSEAVTKVKHDGTSYYVCVKSLNLAGTDGLTLRGIVSQNESINVLYHIVRLSLWLLPLLAAFALLGGYAITRRSFLPVEQIARDAELIGQSGDLSKRLDIGPGDDEIHMLADSFNVMFARLERNFESERQFTSDASHELRTPTAVILAQAEYALELADSIEEYRESMEVVQRQANRMRGIIDQLLMFSRLEQGTQRPELTATDLSELTRELCEEQRLLAVNGITLTAEIEADIRVTTDRGLFCRALTNLISNAYRYGRPNGHIWVSLRRDGQQIRLSVKDDGIGIAPQNLTRIWNRFYQENPTRGEDGEDGARGLGLGLSMVKEIAALLGLRLTVHSEAGKGSEFILTF